MENRCKYQSFTNSVLHRRGNAYSIVWLLKGCSCTSLRGDKWFKEVSIYVGCSSTWNPFLFRIYSRTLRIVVGTGSGFKAQCLQRNMYVPFGKMLLYDVDLNYIWKEVYAKWINNNQSSVYSFTFIHSADPLCQSNVHVGLWVNRHCNCCRSDILLWNCLTSCLLFHRNDEKTAADYKIQGGSVLHLVLALRGGLLLPVPRKNLTP